MGKLDTRKNSVTLLDISRHPEFSEAELNNIYGLFCQYAKPQTTKGQIDLDSLKKLLEMLGLTQTHLEAKGTFEKYTKNGGIQIDEFMKLVKDLTAKNGKLSLDTVLNLAAKEEVSVDDVGVGGAKRFFEAKAHVLKVGDAAYRAFEDRKREEEQRRQRQEDFKKKMEHFQTAQ
ncbi:EF-hand domain-containing protein D1-like isoform X2 [Oratosquilla oratoria]|uniref:EF-hand domain-containing protein D1-like isoform X2 n=1 Tax=Oratosquilla oratoria TaxID=337810 RepID=UPI003F7582B9